MKLTVFGISLTFGFCLGITMPAFCLSPVNYSRVPEASRMVEIDFVVDDPTLLHQGRLEWAMAEDNYKKRLVQISEVPGTDAGLGAANFPAPEGSLNIVVCGLVSCGQSEMELVCGRSQIPDYIAIDKSHQISFSTTRACENQPKSTDQMQTRR